MVFLAISRHGYLSFMALGGKAVGELWLSAGVLTAEELRALRAEGANVSDFNYTIDHNDHEAIAGAVETIKEHHPGEQVWVESWAGPK
jgi:hypothetical protein